MLSAVFCFDLSVFNRSLGKPYNKELQLFSSELMNALMLQIICSGVSEGKVHLPYFLRTSTVLQRLSGCVTYFPIRQIAGLWKAKTGSANCVRDFQEVCFWDIPSPPYIRNVSPVFLPSPSRIINGIKNRYNTTNQMWKKPKKKYSRNLQDLTERTFM